MVVEERRHDNGYKAEGNDIQQAVFELDEQEHCDDKHRDEGDQEYHAAQAAEHLFAQHADKEVESQHHGRYNQDLPQQVKALVGVALLVAAGDLILVALDGRSLLGGDNLAPGDDDLTLLDGAWRAQCVAQVLT